MDNCIFCKIIANELPSDMVYETDDLVAFRDVSPVAPVHILIVPRKHISSLRDLEPNERSYLMPKVFDAVDDLAARENLTEKGFRVVINTGNDGGQTVYHLHFHLLGGRFMQWPPG